MNSLLCGLCSSYVITFNETFDNTGNDIVLALAHITKELQVIKCNLARVVQRMNITIHRINHYPADSVVCFFKTYPDWIAIYPVHSVIQLSKNRGQFVCVD